MTPTFLLVAIVAPVLAGLATLLLPKKAVTARVLGAIAGPAVSFICVLAHVTKLGVSSNTAGTTLIEWIPTLNLNIALLPDGLGVFFALLVSGVGMLIVLYARGYFGPDEASLFRFYPTLGFFCTAMMGVVLSDSMLLTLVFWEMTSISSFLLIGWEREDRHAIKLAMQAFFTTGMGGLALFGGLIMFGETTGVYSAAGDGIWRWSELVSQWSSMSADMRASFVSDPYVIASCLLMFAGAATKSAQWPFHYWLPGAMAAPTPVSAYLHSATMVKAGVYLCGRMFPVFAALEVWPHLLAGLGAITMLLGALLAINQHDLKRIFAYTTVSQLGLLVCMYGLGALKFAHGDHALAAIDLDITQIANHAFYKAPLFIVAGAIGHVAGTRNLPELFGFWKTNDFQKKAMVVTILLAGFALAGGIGTVSFPAKEMFFYATVHTWEHGPMFKVISVMAVVTAICNVGIFVRLFTTLLGIEKYGMKAAPKPAHHDEADHGHGGHGHDDHHHDSVGWASMMWVPAAIIVSLQYIGGLVPPIWNAMFLPLETNINYNAFANGVPWVWEPFFHPSLPLLMTVIAIVGGVSLGLSKAFRGAITDVHDKIYPLTYRAAVEGGAKAFGLIQTGSLRHYILFVLGAFVIGFIAAAYANPEMLQWTGTSVFEYWPGVLIGVIVCASALLLPMVQERVVRVLILGACGFSVVGMYLVYQAPDLALTQLMFEIISVILFVLVLRLLPDPDRKKRPSRLLRAMIGATVGLAVGWMTLIAGHNADVRKTEEAKLGEFFKNHSHYGTEFTDGRGGAGDNIVNVILVDFRGFDTLGEITVLAIAALGVWSLLPGRRRHLADKPVAINAASADGPVSDESAGSVGSADTDTADGKGVAV